MAWSLAVGDRLAYLFCLAAVGNRFANLFRWRGRGRMTASQTCSVGGEEQVRYLCRRRLVTDALAWSLAVGDRPAHLFCLAAVDNRFADHCFARGARGHNC